MDPQQQPAQQPSAAAPDPQPMQPTTPPQTGQTAPLPQLTPPTIVTGGGGKKKLILAIVLAAVVLVAGIGYGVYAYITNTPDYLLRQATEQFGKNNALAASFRIVSGPASGTNTTITGDLAARSDPSDPKKGEFVLGLGTGDNRVALTGRAVDSSVFVKASGLGNIADLMRSMGGSSEADVFDSQEMRDALGRVNDKWFSLTQEDLEALGSTAGSPTELSSSPTPEDLKKVKEIYLKHSFIKADQALSDELVDGVNTAHFSIKVDKDALVAFLTELKSANVKGITITDEQIEEVKKEDLTIKNGTIEVWITRDTKEFKQVRAVSAQSGSEGSFTLTFETNLPELEPIEAPTDATPFSEFINMFLGPLYTQPSLGSDFDDDFDF